MRARLAAARLAVRLANPRPNPLGAIRARAALRTFGADPDAPEPPRSVRALARETLAGPRPSALDRLRAWGALALAAWADRGGADCANCGAALSAHVDGTAADGGGDPCAVRFYVHAPAFHAAEARRLRAEAREARRAYRAACAGADVDAGAAALAEFWAAEADRLTALADSVESC